MGRKVSLWFLVAALCPHPTVCFVTIRRQFGKVTGNQFEISTFQFGNVKRRDTALTLSGKVSLIRQLPFATYAPPAPNVHLLLERVWS